MLLQQLAPFTCANLFSLHKLKKSKQKKIKPEQLQALRGLDAQYGGCVRQRSAHQGTTIAKASTLAKFRYMSFSSQLHGPFEIDSVDQPPNSDD